MLFKNGRTTWNKGLTKETDERIRKIAESKIGKKHSKETIRKISEALKGKNHPFYGVHRSRKTKTRISRALTSKDPENLSKIFTKDCKQVLFGSILGDASLIVDGINCYFEEVHSIKQRDYLRWKYIFLKLFNAKTKSKQFKNYKLNKIYRQFLLRTSSSPTLTEFHNQFYPNGKKTITINILNQLDELGLAIWYLDDGHITLLENLVIWSTDNYTYKEHLLIQEWFNKRLKVYPKISKRKGRCYLTFNRKDSEILLSIFKKVFKEYNIPESMFYKLGRFWDGNKEKIKVARKKKNDYKKKWREKRSKIKEIEKVKKLKNLAEKIQRLYWAKELSLSQVGKKLGYSHSGVLKLMKRFNIPRRTLSEACFVAKTGLQNALFQRNHRKTTRNEGLERF